VSGGLARPAGTRNLRPPGLEVPREAATRGSTTLLPSLRVTRQIETARLSTGFTPIGDLDTAAFRDTRRRPMSPEVRVLPCGESRYAISARRPETLGLRFGDGERSLTSSTRGRCRFLREHPSFAACERSVGLSSIIEMISIRLRSRSSHSASASPRSLLSSRVETSASQSPSETKARWSAVNSTFHKLTSSRLPGRRIPGLAVMVRRLSRYG